MLYCFITCENMTTFWKTWVLRWKQLTGFNRREEQKTMNAFSLHFQETQITQKSIIPFYMQNISFTSNSLMILKHRVPRLSCPTSINLHALKKTSVYLIIKRMFLIFVNTYLTVTNISKCMYN